jgi:hypothetical protein
MPPRATASLARIETSTSELTEPTMIREADGQLCWAIVTPLARPGGDPLLPVRGHHRRRRRRAARGADRGALGGSSAAARSATIRARDAQRAGPRQRASLRGDCSRMVVRARPTSSRSLGCAVDQLHCAASAFAAAQERVADIAPRV